MKRFYFSLLVAVAIAFAACNGKKSEPENGDGNSNKPDTTATDPGNGGKTDPDEGNKPNPEGEGSGGGVEAIVNNNFKALPFSVGPDKTVIFSQGNLQYHAASKTWRFAGEQWEYVGDKVAGNVYEGGVKSNNRSIADDYDGWIDIFGFGTSGWKSGAVEYQPYAHSTTSSDYYVGGSSFNNLTGQYAEADWGVHNPILNGGYTKGMWRTLTADEWLYILHDRPLAQGLVSTAMIDDVRGIVIVPDNWTGAPAGLEFYAFIDKPKTIEWNPAMHAYESKSSVQDINKYTKEEWKLMEAAGAVFLPCGGRRKGTTIEMANWNACYWSSTVDSDVETYAYTIGCQGSGFYAYARIDRWWAYCVRLVK